MEYKSEIVFTGSEVEIGKFWCPSESSLWSEENIAGRLPMLVFPRKPVRILQSGRLPVIASPNQVMFYNANQTYRRQMIGQHDDVCEYFYLRPETIGEVMLEVTGRRPPDPMSPFDFATGPCASSSFLIQRVLFNATNEANVDSLYLQELFLTSLYQLVAEADQSSNRKLVRDVPMGNNHRDQVEAVKAFIGIHFRRRISLEELASEASCSSFHLCRIFRSYTGLTMQRFVSQMRLRNSLQAVLDDRKRSLTDIALDCGFSSHSHFTNSFRQVFGLTPRQLRQGNLRQIAKLIDRR